MEHIAPLIQTVLWVALIGGVVWRFHKPIYGLLTALQRRIEAGSNIKAGPFELTEQIRPQDPAKQEAKVVDEIKEIQQDEANNGLQPPQIEDRTRAAKTRYFQAEDLVLRAIQAEYGTPISRQVTAGRDDGFDGLFLAGGRMNVIEVKYVSGKGSGHRFQETVARLTSSIQAYGWPNAQIVLALVFENSEDIRRTREILSAMFLKNPVPVVVRCYSFSELQSLFGVGGNGAG